MEFEQDRGVTLIAVLILVLISSIMLGAAMPLWTTVVKREREEELIYRGEQYVRAIEEFQLTVGRPPNKLEELLEYKTIDQKRFIRRLYEDPMTEDGKWELLYADAATLGGRRRPSGREGARGPTSMRDREQDARGTAGDDDTDPRETSGPSMSNVRYAMPGRASREQMTGGFILGVRSRSEEESVKIYQGAEVYNEWLFKARLIRRAPGRQPRNYDPRMYSRPGDRDRRTRTPPNLKYKGGIQRRWKRR